jgi:hypothetical protein
MIIADPPEGRNIHRPKPGDRVRLTVEARVKSVNGDSVTVETIAMGSTTLHRDFMVIVEYAQD